MRIHFEIVPTAVALAVVTCWLVFAAIFLFHKKPPKAPESKRDSSSTVGIVLQGTAYATLWIIRRQWFTPIFRVGKGVEILIGLLTVALAIASVWIVTAAVHTLGKQWAFVARVVEGHKLITEGPYRFVRNPIYTGMLGMLVATGLAVSHLLGLVIAIALFSIGTAIRVRSEEKILREFFGAEFNAYASRVPAIFPRF